ncbi:hypothetical protein [Dysgonomonas capnocytophagoides]|uniref:hypothetical protein n=1 Tax=Dysgonomonas capnocytophagoides TaxID=45254 RepID=UPI0033402EEB
MKTDIYTKIVLTVIAIALSAIALQNVNLVTTAKADTTVAAPAPMPNAVHAAPVDVNITHVDGKPISITTLSSSFSEGIPVEIRSNRDK